jgi:hypothetical protein
MHFALVGTGALDILLAELADHGFGSMAVSHGRPTENEERGFSFAFSAEQAARK